MLAALSCKVLAIYVLINVIGHLNWTVMSIEAIQPDVGPFEIFIIVLSILIPFFLLAAFGYVLWFRTDYFAQRMFAEDCTEKESKLKSDDIQAIAFSAVGALVLANAIPDMVQQTFYYYKTQSDQYMFSGEWNNYYTLSRIAGLGLKIVIGLWLFLGSQGIVGLVNTLRKAGIKKPEV